MRRPRRFGGIDIHLPNPGSTMSDLDRRYWFPAKRYGWGWGFPITWQGWVVLLVWLAILYPGAVWTVSRHWALFTIFIIAMTTSLFAICYAKGEPPRWRWGDEKPDKAKETRQDM
jgi:hypothetical protein